MAKGSQSPEQVARATQALSESLKAVRAGLEALSSAAIDAGGATWKLTMTLRRTPREWKRWKRRRARGARRLSGASRSKRVRGERKLEAQAARSAAHKERVLARMSAS